MKLIKAYFLFIVLIINFSCGFDKEQKFQEARLGKDGWVYDPISQDTLNKTDTNNLKQGKWIIFRRADERSTTNMNSMDSLGYYLDGKKVGYWKKYSMLGDLMDSVLYENGIPKVEANKTYSFDPN